MMLPFQAIKRWTAAIALRIFDTSMVAHKAVAQRRHGPLWLAQAQIESPFHIQLIPLQGLLPIWVARKETWQWTDGIDACGERQPGTVITGITGQPTHEKLASVSPVANSRWIQDQIRCQP